MASQKWKKSSSLPALTPLPLLPSIVIEIPGSVKRCRLGVRRGKIREAEAILMRAAAEGARMSLGFAEIEWGRLSSSRPVFCPGQRPPAARQRGGVEADRAAAGGALSFPRLQWRLQSPKQVQIQNAQEQEPQDILETSCVRLYLCLCTFLRFLGRAPFTCLIMRKLGRKRQLMLEIVQNVA